MRYIHYQVLSYGKLLLQILLFGESSGIILKKVPENAEFC
jgi:hypothetical protein